jgi:hypothetical protein
MKRAVLISLLPVVAAAIAATPWIVRHNGRVCVIPPSANCINNFRQLDGAKLVWALEEHKGSNDISTMAQVAKFIRSVPTRPSGGVYTLGRVGENPRCSISGHALP